MYHLKDYKDPISNLQMLSLSNGKTTLELCPDYGGALGRLCLDEHVVIQAPDHVNDPHTYAGSVLFPFANRIQAGTYQFEGQTYQLPCNEVNGKNAIHGLVYNQSFKVVNSNVSADEAFVELAYHTAGHQFTGFPFQFELILRYTLKARSLVLDVCIENKDTCAFPFGLGWHPYFFSEHTQDRKLQLVASSRLLTNEAQVPVDETNERVTALFVNRFYDDCFRLESPEVVYHTPDYRLKLHSASEVNFLQVFTPKNPRFFAIEYMTAPANGFNNKKGLLILRPDAAYRTSWKLELI